MPSGLYILNASLPFYLYIQDACVGHEGKHVKIMVFLFDGIVGPPFALDVNRCLKDIELPAFYFAYNTYLEPIL